MKNYIIVLLVSVSFLSFAQKKDKKSEKASSIITGTWIAESADKIHANKDERHTTVPIDTYIFNEDGTFKLSSKTSEESDEQIILGKWKITNDSDLLYLTEMDSKFPVKSSNDTWVFYIRLKKDRLSMFYRINDYTKSDFGRNQEITVIDFKRS